MRPLIRIIGILVASEWRAVAQGLALSAVVLIMGTALLGLSGWFIVAAAMAGLAGIGFLFNVFAPSAMVRFLALGRTAARYGERLATHDAVLRALSALRLRLLQGLIVRPYREVERLRAAAVLNRVTADVDALDGALLRLVLPGAAGLVAILLATAVLWWLVHPAVALVVGLGYLVAPNIVFLIGQRRARRPSRQAEAAMQATRNRLIELVSMRDDLTVYGQITAAVDRCHTATARHAAARQRMSRIERATGIGFDLIVAALTAAALGFGIMLVQAGQIDAARAAIGVLVALALAETIAPIRRALSDIGRMVQAARRVYPSLDAGTGATPAQPRQIGTAPRLQLDALGYRPRSDGPLLFSPLTITVAPGETVALTGPSGIGKSTVLLMAAGAIPPSEGQVRIGGIEVRTLDATYLHQHLVMVPLRHALIAGTVAGNLRLAAPAAGDDMLWRALTHVRLADKIRARGGLEMPLGPRGTGLSGGEARRLVLARAILPQPAILLLDEPTEGLDPDTATHVMAGIRAALPEAAILVAAHRSTERAAADRVVALRHPDAWR